MQVQCLNRFVRALTSINHALHHGHGVIGPSDDGGLCSQSRKVLFPDVNIGNTELYTTQISRSR